MLLQQRSVYIDICAWICMDQLHMRTVFSVKRVLLAELPSTTQTVSPMLNKNYVIPNKYVDMSNRRICFHDLLCDMNK